jgi:hypothetical protein
MSQGSNLARMPLRRGAPMILPGRSDRLLAGFYAAYHAGPIFPDMDSRGSSRAYSFGLKAIEEKQTIDTLSETRLSSICLDINE